MMKSRLGCCLAICSFAVSFIPGCALLSKGDQGAARYFSIEYERSPTKLKHEDEIGSETEKITLRLGRVTGALYLEERLVYRKATDEVAFYRERRWTEPPEKFLQQMLSRALFENRGLVQVVGGASPTLDVELSAFEEYFVPEHRVRAQVGAILHDEHLVLWEETLTAERPVMNKTGQDPTQAAVAALGYAMQAVTDQIADRVVRALTVRKSVPTNGEAVLTSKTRQPSTAPDNR